MKKAASELAGVASKGASHSGRKREVGGIGGTGDLPNMNFFGGVVLRLSFSKVPVQPIQRANYGGIGYCRDCTKIKKKIFCALGVSHHNT